MIADEKTSQFLDDPERNKHVERNRELTVLLGKSNSFFPQSTISVNSMHDPAAIKAEIGFLENNRNAVSQNFTLEDLDNFVLDIEEIKKLTNGMHERIGIPILFYTNESERTVESVSGLPVQWVSANELEYSMSGFPQQIKSTILARIHFLLVKSNTQVNLTKPLIFFEEHAHFRNAVLETLKEDLMSVKSEITKRQALFHQFFDNPESVKNQLLEIDIMIEKVIQSRYASIS